MDEYLNTLERFEFDIPILRIKAKFQHYEIDASNLQPEGFSQIKNALAHQNYDVRPLLKAIRLKTEGKSFQVTKNNLA